MSEKKKHRKQELEDFLRYSANNMSGEEKNAFERELQKDPFDEEAMEGFSSLDASTILSDVDELRSKLKERLTGRRSTRMMYFRLAASVALLIMVTGAFYFYFLGRTDKLPAETAVAVKDKSGEEVIQPAEIHTETRIETEAISPSSGQPASPGVSTPISKAHPSQTSPPHGKEVGRPEKKAFSGDISLQETDFDEETEGTPAERPVQLFLSEAAESDDHQGIFEFKQDSRIAESLVPEKEAENPVRVMATKLATEPAHTAQSKDSGKIMIRGLANRGANQLHPWQSKDSLKVTIRGRVISGEDQLPIAGAGIILHGGYHGTITGPDGSFELEVPDTGSIIRAVFIGMEAAEFSAGKNEPKEIVLQPSQLALDEVVVVGYGSTKKTAATGAVSVVKPDENSQSSGYIPAQTVSGPAEFSNYIKSEQVFPEGTGLNRAVVILNFTIDSNGRPENIMVLRSPHEAFSQEAIRLLKNSPDWQPAMSGDIILDESVRVRMVFKKDN